MTLEEKQDQMLQRNMNKRRREGNKVGRPDWLDRAILELPFTTVIRTFRTAK